MFRDKHVVITGGSSGLGLELAHRLAALSARLTLAARDLKKLEAAAKAIRKRHTDAQVHIESMDVTDEDAAHASMQRIAGANAGIDMLINSAGILREGRVEAMAMKDFRDVMEINYFGLLIATRAALPHLKASRGRVVNIASMAGLTGAFGYTSYCASKHALVGLSDCLRYELKPMGISVHLVCPGEFDSPMVDELDKYRTPENKAHTLSIPKSSVEAIAQDTLDGIRADRYFIVPTAAARFFANLIRYAPGITRVVGDRTIAKVQRATGKA
jgi:3-dehydrosphinganine reductase